MPATSRKRNKGKDRKAKKLEKDRVRINNLWWGWIIGDPRTIKLVQCHHGTNLENLKGSHPVSHFMDSFFTHWYDKQIYVLEILKDIFPLHHGVYSSDEYRNMVIKIFTHIGTNMLLKGDTEREDLFNAIGMAETITVLEQYARTGNIMVSINGRIAASKCRDFHLDSSSSRRDALKFFRKRISCKCLKKMHLEARKTMPKMGICSGCNKEVERELLDVCSRCVADQYCSRECQVSHWPEHERNCCIFVYAQKQNTSSS